MVPRRRELSLEESVVGVLLLILLTCLLVPPAVILAFTMAGGVFATMGLFLVGFAGAAATAVGLFLLPVALSHLKPQVPADLR